MPPAFNLSQDQTLRLLSISASLVSEIGIAYRRRFCPDPLLIELVDKQPVINFVKSKLLTSSPADRLLPTGLCGFLGLNPATQHLTEVI